MICHGIGTFVTTLFEEMNIPLPNPSLSLPPCGLLKGLKEHIWSSYLPSVVQAIRNLASKVLSFPNTVFHHPLHPKRELYVLSLPADDKTLSRLDRIVQKWQTSALAKLKQDSSASMKTIFEDSYHILRILTLSINWKKNSSIPIPYDTVHICYDKTLRHPQALACTKKSAFHLEITHLVTNPINIRSPSNSTERTRVEGAGSKLIAYLAKMARDEDYSSLHLQALDSSLPFYEKLGFRKVRPCDLSLSVLQPLYLPLSPNTSY